MKKNEASKYKLWLCIQFDYTFNLVLQTILHQMYIMERTNSTYKYFQMKLGFPPDSKFKENLEK